MRKSLFLAGWIGAAAGAVAGLMPLQGALAQEEEPTISIDVTEAYLEDVLKLFSKQSGVNLVGSEETQGKKVTLYLDQVPFQAALASLLEANRLSLRTMGEKNLYVVTESGIPKISTVTKVFRLKYARVVPTAGDLLPTFGLTGSLITSTFGSSTTSGTTGTGSSGSATSGTTGITGTSGKEGGILPVIRSLLTTQGSVIADARTNSLIVTDIPPQMEIIQRTIAQLDVRQRQIYIEAEVLEITLDTLRRLGLEYGSSTGTIGSYVGPKRTSYFPFHRGLLEAGSLTHTLGTLSLAESNILFKLLATEKDVKFLARPRLLTLSNEVAEIRIVADAVTGVTSTSQATTGTVTEEVERNTVGTILRVTPLVNDDRYVTMVIEPEVSRVIQSSSFSKFLDPNRRAARTTVMVQDGGTVLIAGLISAENTQSSRRIPGLGDIPILGLLFKSTDTERKNTEIILFITPHILKDEEEPTLVLDREQTPLTPLEKHWVEAKHHQILKERAIAETVENILR